MQTVGDELFGVPHAARVDAAAVLRTAVAAVAFARSGLPAAEPVAHAPTDRLAAAWALALCVEPLDAVQLAFLTLADPAELHEAVAQSPSDLGGAFLLAHGEALDPQFPEFPAPWDADPANDRLHGDAALCLFALSVLSQREDALVRLGVPFPRAQATRTAYALARLAGDRSSRSALADPAVRAAIAEVLRLDRGTETSAGLALLLERTAGAAPAPADRKRARQ